jgi:hypothetical protein
MTRTQNQVSQSLKELSGASAHLTKFAEQSHVPADLGARITEMAQQVCALADDMEAHYDEFGDRQAEEDDPNAGFDQIMDADITSMLRELRLRFK